MWAELKTAGAVQGLDQPTELMPEFAVSNQVTSFIWRARTPALARRPARWWPWLNGGFGVLLRRGGGAGVVWRRAGTTKRRAAVAGGAPAARRSGRPVRALLAGRTGRGRGRAPPG